MKNKLIHKILNEAKENMIRIPKIPNSMNFYHGGNLEKYNDVIAQKNGRYKYGAGLYLTTEY